MAKSRAQFVGVEHRDLPFNPAFVCEALDATQARRRRDVEALGQGHVAQRGVMLQGVE